MMHRLGTTGAVIAGLLLVGSAPAWAALSASATISTPDTGPTYHYTVQLHNTGTTDIGTFWFAWTPPGDPVEYGFLPSAPSATGQPTGWTGLPISQFPGNSIEYYNVSDTSHDILAGQTGTFTFTTTDSPATLQGLAFGTFPLTESFIYTGAPLVGSPAQVNPVFVAAPEPSSLILLALGCAGTLWRRRRHLSV